VSLCAHYSITHSSCVKPFPVYGATLRVTCWYQATHNENTEPFEQAGDANSSGERRGVTRTRSCCVLIFHFIGKSRWGVTTTAVWQQVRLAQYSAFLMLHWFCKVTHKNFCIDGDVLFCGWGHQLLSYVFTTRSCPKMAGEGRRLATQPESVSAMFIKPVIGICLRLFQFNLNQFFVKVVLCSIFA